MVDQASQEMFREILGKATGSIELGPRVWKISYGASQLAELERLNGGAHLLQIIAAASLKYDTLAKCLWVAMHRVDPKITERKVLGFFDDDKDKIEPARYEVIGAVLRAMPPLRDEDGSLVFDPLALAGSTAPAGEASGTTGTNS